MQVYISLYTKQKCHRPNQGQKLRIVVLVIAGMAFRAGNGDVLTSFATRSEISPGLAESTCAYPKFPCCAFEAQYLSCFLLIRRQLVPVLDDRPGLHLAFVIPRDIRVPQRARGRLFTVAN